MNRLLFFLAVATAGFARWSNEGSAVQMDEKLLCDSCTVAVDMLHAFLEYDYNAQEDVEKLITDACEFVMQPQVCSNLVSMFANIVITTVGDRYVTSDVVCWRLHVCPTPPYITANITQLVNEILADAPPVVPLPPLGNETYRFLHVSDIHLDLLYEPGSDMMCGYPMCCRNEFGTTNDTLRKAGYWGSLAACDIPLRTVEAFMKQAQELDVDFILWTGDNPGHAVWQFTREGHLLQSEVLTWLFRTHFPHTTMYPILGNHACFPEDQYHLGHEQWLTEGLANLWADWLPPSAQATQAENAYYSLKDPLTGLRIIAINTMMCDNLNFWLVSNDTDPGNHLQWLRAELYSAEQAGEYVFIIGHIPTGDVFCESTWAIVYRAIANRFRNIIRGQFFGHTHQDQFQVVRSLTEEPTPAGVLYILPSLTTFSAQNPAFRIFELDKDTLQIVDFETYRLNLFAANQDTDHMPSFDLAYEARSEYGLPDLSPRSWQALADAMQAGNKTLIDKYWLNFYSSETLTDCSESCQKMLWCGAQTSVLDEWVACSGLSMSNIAFYLLERLLGPWETRFIN